MQLQETAKAGDSSRKELKLKEYRIICFLSTTVEFSAVEDFRKKLVSLVEDDLNGYVRKAAKFKQYLVKTKINKGNRSIQVVLLQVFLEPYQIKKVEEYLLLLKEMLLNSMILKESGFLSEEDLSQRKEREQGRREISKDRNKNGHHRNY